MNNLPSSAASKNNNPYIQLLNNNPLPCSSITNSNTTQDQTCQCNEGVIKEMNNNILKLLEKSAKAKQKKNTYLKITKAMFEKDIQPEYTDFPVDKIEMLYSDGKDYYIEIGNKKYPLNKKYFLKFINYILK